MRKLIVTSLMTASLGAAVLFTLGTPYEAAARNLEITQLECVDVLKTAYRHDAMQELDQQPELPAMTFATPARRT